MITVMVVIIVLVLGTKEQLLLHTFVGQHYYCESGNTGSYINSQYHTEDPLWDGAGCLPRNNCCTNPDQPWFFRQLAMKRQDNIESRLCTDQSFDNEAIFAEKIQLYVYIRKS